MGIVLCTADLFEEHTKRLHGAGHTVRQIIPFSQGSVIAQIGDADALICMLTDRIGPTILEAGSRLKIVANVAVGYENIDLDAAQAHSIIVTNTPDVLTESTADHAFALLLAAARRIPEADRSARKGEFPAWGLQQPLTGLDVYGKTLGIVGMGRIGTAVARRAHHGFGMSIIYTSRTRKPAIERELNAQQVSWNDLLATSDFVSIHVPATKDTTHLFDASAFSRMKPTAILVNVARGAVVDEVALARALRDHVIAGAGVDVFEHEPAIHPELLQVREHVALSAHLASATAETRKAMGNMAIENVLAVLGNRPPLTPVH